jgi:hypothetical protein
MSLPQSIYRVSFDKIRAANAVPGTGPDCIRALSSSEGNGNRLWLT